jgi:hypothetical protein
VGKLRLLLYNKTGASMMFVLASMALLMILGTAAMRVASANAGAWHAKRDFNQLQLYSDSIQRAIEFDLRNNGELEQRIAGQIHNETVNLGASKEMNRAGFLRDEGFDFSWDVAPSIGTDGLLDEIYDVQIDVWYESVFTNFRNHEPAEMEWDADDEVWILIREEVPERLQRVAVEDCRVKVTVTTRHRGRTLATCVTYRFSGSRWSARTVSRPGHPTFLSRDANGIWEVVSHERLSQ